MVWFESVQKQRRLDKELVKCQEKLEKKHCDCLPPWLPKNGVTTEKRIGLAHFQGRDHAKARDKHRWRIHLLFYIPVICGKENSQMRAPKKSEKFGNALRESGNLNNWFDIML